MARAASDDPVTAYAPAVVEGRTVSNRLVRLACERHLEDLASGAARGLRFDRQASQHAIAFFKADDLARKAEKAIALPGAQNAFRRMHLNEWTEQAERWIDLAAWDACSGPVDLEQLRGRTCLQACSG